MCPVGSMFVLNSHVGRSTKDADEELASLVLGTALDARVERVDKWPLQGHHDLEIYYSDGRLGVGEVVSTRDPIWTELTDAVSGRGYSKRAELTYLWFVLIRPGTSLKRIQSQVPSLLRRLENHRLRRWRSLLRSRNGAVPSHRGTGRGPPAPTTPTTAAHSGRRGQQP